MARPLGSACWPRSALRRSNKRWTARCHRPGFTSLDLLPAAGIPQTSPGMTSARSWSCLAAALVKSTRSLASCLWLASGPPSVADSAAFHACDSSGAKRACATWVLADVILLHRSPGRAPLGRVARRRAPDRKGGCPHAVQGQCRPPAPHSQAAPPGHELGEHDAALRARGSLTISFTPEAVAAWAAAPRISHAGRPLL